ncbi:reverse gyrase [Ignicoccus pacificus DSM 13166]|uniref:Reverse gyrase n=1 Tax=Ignicoccus pacificus DSM 13166 TaxID=940294 RepID=A0A977PJV0_9CREN|nr:reverse gyrase [Ignicoccus pacificus DSM 13166]
MYAEYRGACPVCGGPISDERLSKGLPCKMCLPKEEMLEIALKELERKYPNSPYIKYKKLMEEVRKLESAFKEVTRSVFWSAQRAWAIRALRGESFSIIAPTGMGKSTFGAAITSYLAGKGRGKAYIVVPTTPLVEMMAKKVQPFADLFNLRLVYVHSKLSPSVKKEMEKKFEEGEFDILITTSRFLINRLEQLRRFKYSIIFVDDVDSVLKSPKNVDRLLLLLGLEEDDIQELFEITNKERRLIAYLTRTNDPERRKEFLEELEEARRKVEEMKKKVSGILIVSSATGRVRTDRVRLFKTLLGFEPGGGGEGVRNVVDSYTKRKELVELVRLLGKGGLVYVPVDEGVEGARKVVEALNEEGIKAALVTSENTKSIEEFERGEVEVLVGVATHYGVLVRGIDLPHVIRYAVFKGVPRLKFKLRLEEPSPMTIYRILSIAVELMEDEELERLYAKIRGWMKRLSPQAIKTLEERLKEGKVETQAEKDFYEAFLKVRELARSEEFLRRIEESGELEVRVEEGEAYLLVPDSATYLQASGRTSRLYAGGVTKGLSVIIVDSEPLFRGLRKRLRWVIDEWVEFESLDLQKLLKEIDEDRKKVLKVMRGELTAEEVKKLLKTVLLIVESPNKARTITNFFGRPSVRNVGGARVYEISIGDKLLYVAASGGHTYDLVGESDPLCVAQEGEECLYYGVYGTGKTVLTSIKRCMVCGTQFSEDSERCIRCSSPFLKNSRDVIEGLRLIAEEVDEVLIGTDPDTEGEKIGWDVANLLRPFSKKMRRVEFHEVTKRAILEAIEGAREFDMHLVEAQMMRRVEDRLIGFTLSPKLWLDFWPKFCKEHIGNNCLISRNLSAGRVQTPVLGWVIERYEEYLRSKKRFYIIYFGEDWSESFPEDLFGGRPSRKDLMLTEVVVKYLEEREEELKPRPPFTTDSMLEEANERLRMGAEETMRIAQDLFEMGFITYHRTDSTRVSDVGIAIAKEWIANNFGEEEFVPRRWGEGGAHEAIRPTRPLTADDLRKMIEEGLITTPKQLTRRHFALYSLIFQRFMASQMREAKVKYLKFEVTLGDFENVKVEKEVPIEVTEEGFLKVYPIVRIVQPIPEGTYKVKKVIITTRHATPLYTQADLIKLMKERGLGRPSTYAKIVETLLQRRYIMESKNVRKLIPTKKGRAVYQYLTSKYPKLVSEERTRELEKTMDEIAEGKRSYWEVVRGVIEETKKIPVEGSPLD